MVQNEKGHIIHKIPKCVCFSHTGCLAYPLHTFPRCIFFVPIIYRVSWYEVQRNILVGWPLYDCMDPRFPLYQTNVVHWLLHQRIHSPGIPVSSENSAYNGSHSAETRPGMFISMTGVNRDPFLHMSHATFLWSTLRNQHGNRTISNVEGTLHTQN